MKTSWLWRMSVLYTLMMISATALPLSTASAAIVRPSDPTAGSGIVKGPKAFGGNVTSNIYSRRRRSLQAIKGNEQRIWDAIKRNHLRRARGLIDRTVAEFPGWHPHPIMTFVLLEKSIWDQIRADHLQVARKQMQDLRTDYGHGVLASQAQSAMASMRTVIKDNELWGLLGHGHLYRVQAAIRRMEARDPGYRPPRKLLTMLKDDLRGRKLRRLERAHDWTQILVLHRREPALFSRTNSTSRLALAQALAATGHIRQARAVYAGLLQDARTLGQAEALLSQAAAHLTVADMQSLYARAEAGLPKDWRALRDAHLRYLLMKAAQAQAAHHNRRALALVASQGPAIMTLHAAADARLMGSLYAAAGQRRQALKWWLRAADWSGKSHDWRMVGTLALANHDPALMAAAVAHLPSGTKVRIRMHRQADFMRALSAFRHGRYAATLRILHNARRLGPVPPGMRAIKGWSLIRTDHFEQAATLFTALYRVHPTSGNAAGVVIADWHLHRLTSAYRLAATVGGPLAARLPMTMMADHLRRINDMPWRFVAPDNIAAPRPRQSYLAVGVSGEERGGRQSGLANMTAYVPSLQAQFGINWHLSAFAQVAAPLIEGGQPSRGQLPTTDTAGGGLPGAADMTMRAQEKPGFMLGIDNRRTHAHWRMAFGWAFPGIKRQGTPQGLLRYTAIPSRNGSSFGFHVLRDRVRQTLISYNGTRETLGTAASGTGPTSATWGAAMRNQIGASGYASGGPHGWSYIGTLHLNIIDGTHIRTNYGASTYLAVMRPVFTARHWWVAIGPSLYAEAYQRNEDFVSPGYGGYFSPQWMGQPSLSGSASHWWHGGGIHVSAALGYQWLYEAGGPYIGSPSLQNTLAPVGASAGLGAAYGRTSAHSVAGSVNVNFTQRITGSWYVDTGASYQANPAFQEFTAGLDIRDVFGGKARRTFVPAQYLANMGRYE